ncbi:MAG: redoxin domain-containing protein [Acidobacteria bacterium]|nr:redoxin domain-containing protein [Acidobacteriota bacterium]
MKRSYLLLTFFCMGIMLLFISIGSLAPRGWAAAPRSTLAQDDAFDDALGKARLHFNRRNYEDALKFYKRANKLKGESCADCLWGMAQTYSKLGADKNVIETCERLVPAAGSDNEMVAKAHNLKGITLAAMAMEKMEKPDLKKLADAEAAFRLALAAYPETKIVHYNLGITLIRLGREAEGIQELKAYVEDADEDSESGEEARKIIANPRRARENFAPDFSVTTAAGEYIDSDELRGKIVLVDFWGTWCPPCRESIPALASLAKKFSKDPFVLLSVDVGDEPGQWRAFIEKNKMTWAQHQDVNGKVQRAFQVRSFPTYVLIDHEGVVRYRSSGYSDYVEGMIADAVKKSLKTAAKAAPPKAQAAPTPAPQRSPAPAPAQSAPAAQTAGAPTASEEKKPRELPVPVLEVTGAETMDAGGMKITRFYLSLKNWADYPDVLFAPMPDLPPCSFNTTPTRIQVIVWSEDQRPLTTYCNVPDRSLLQRLQVMSRMQGESTPGRVYVTLEDRRAQRIVRSTPVPLVAPAPKEP